MKLFEHLEFDIDLCSIRAGKLEHKEMGQRWKARLDGLVKFNPESIQVNYLNFLYKKKIR